MDREVEELKRRPGTLEPVDGRLAAVDGAIVDDPKDALSSCVGFSAHDHADETVEGLDGVSSHDLSEEFPAMDVPSGLIRTCPMPSVFVLDPHPRPGAGGVTGARRLRIWS